MSYALPQYTPEELEEASGYPPLERGTYDFEVIERIQDKSKNGNPQERLTLNVFHRPEHSMKCFHTFTYYSEEAIKANPKLQKTNVWLVSMMYKFLDCVGIERVKDESGNEFFEKDAFARVLHRRGKAFFEVGEYTNKNGEKREKFMVMEKGFISPKEATAQPKLHVAEEEGKKAFDDDIPF